ncbi:hypothetical protein C0Q70_09271 [Pomacea canaliculata]|uniref:G-protein coupled receptors family 2 profile 2 domain-containing protein n=1 Tax=Pomacea canaliculata TaxID=400727 RepID=A0A2T7P9B7_POMCA|nr:hypothetical protein C0Q70_09271 [Pomacea canaliculata]
MFCEGLFLHTIIVHAFSKEKKLLRICYGVGWAVPVVPTIIYACIRAVDQELDKECWIPHSWALWTIIAPVIVSLIVNFAFFLNILRILMSKLRAFNSHEQLQYRRAVKAVLIMIPLFGTNNLIMLVRPEMSREGVRVWKIISAFLVAYQGVAVSLIFCFFNGEVMTVLRRKWSQWRHTHDHGVLGRLRSTSNTMAITMDDMSAANRNGYPTTTSKTASKHAQRSFRRRVLHEGLVYVCEQNRFVVEDERSGEPRDGQTCPCVAAVDADWIVRQAEISSSSTSGPCNIQHTDKTVYYMGGNPPESSLHSTNSPTAAVAMSPRI